MVNQNLLNMVIFFGAIVGLSIGIRGFKNKDTENIYKATNWLIFGIVMGLYFIFEIYCQSLKDRVSKDYYENLEIVGFVVMFFSTGIYGVIYKNKINDAISFKFSRASVIISIIYAIGKIAFWLRWHH